jgi:hypothetical protein
MATFSCDWVRANRSWNRRRVSWDEQGFVMGRGPSFGCFFSFLLGCCALFLESPGLGTAADQKYLWRVSPTPFGRIKTC